MQPVQLPTRPHLQCTTAVAGAATAQQHPSDRDRLPHVCLRDRLLSCQGNDDSQLLRQPVGWALQHVQQQQLALLVLSSRSSGPSHVAAVLLLLLHRVHRPGVSPATTLQGGTSRLASARILHHACTSMPTAALLTAGPSTNRITNMEQ